MVMRDETWEVLREQFRLATQRKWKTLVLGTKSIAGYRDALEKSPYAIHDQAIRFLDHPRFTVAPEPIEVDLFRIPVMGYREDREGAYLQDIFLHAASCGLERSPLEVFAAFPLQVQCNHWGDDLNYPYATDTFLGTDPIHGSRLKQPLPGGYFLGFGYEQYSGYYGRKFYRRSDNARGLHLCCDVADLEDFWKGNFFVFVKPRNP